MDLSFRNIPNTDMHDAAVNVAANGKAAWLACHDDLLLLAKKLRPIIGMTPLESRAGTKFLPGL
jgi:hypothetical protein